MRLQKPRPVGNPSVCYYEDRAIFAVEWTKPRPQVFFWQMEIVPERCRDVIAEWLVMEGRKRGVEWTQDECLRLLFGTLVGGPWVG